MTTSRKTLVNNPESGWDLAFWFAILSPVLGFLVGFLALLLLVH
jgi:hypothetical protein